MLYPVSNVLWFQGVGLAQLVRANYILTRKLMQNWLSWFSTIEISFFYLHLFFLIIFPFIVFWYYRTFLSVCDFLLYTLCYIDSNVRTYLSIIYEFISLLVLSVYCLHKDLCKQKQKSILKFYLKPLSFFKCSILLKYCISILGALLLGFTPISLDVDQQKKMKYKIQIP